MFDTIRKMMYFGLGAAAMSTDRMRQFVDDLVSRGDVTAEEGKKLYDEFTSRMEEEGHSVNDRIRAQVQSVMKDMGMVDRTQFAMMEARIAALERRLENMPITEPEPTSMVDIEPSI